MNRRGFLTAVLVAPLAAALQSTAPRITASSSDEVFPVAWLRDPTPAKTWRGRELVHIHLEIDTSGMARIRDAGRR